MPSQTIEERLSELETKVARLLGEEPEAKELEVKKPASWLEQWFGAFKDNPDFDAAMEAGAAYRRSQPTAADEWEASTKECEANAPTA